MITELSVRYGSVACAGAFFVLSAVSGTSDVVSRAAGGLDGCSCRGFSFDIFGTFGMLTGNCAVAVFTAKIATINVSKIEFSFFIVYFCSFMNLCKKSIQFQSPFWYGPGQARPRRRHMRYRSKCTRSQPRKYLTK